MEIGARLTQIGFLLKAFWWLRAERSVHERVDKLEAISCATGCEFSNIKISRGSTLQCRSIETQLQQKLSLSHGKQGRSTDLSVGAALASDKRSISSCSTLRSISSSGSGLDVISIFSLAAASSTRSIALSGRKRSAMYRSAITAASTSALSLIRTPWCNSYLHCIGGENSIHEA